MRIIFAVIVLGLAGQSTAQIPNTQYDWSGGPIVRDPVWEFDDHFLISDSVNWQTPFQLTLEEGSSGYRTYGVLVSSVLIIPQPTDAVMWGLIYWDASTPSETALEFYVRASLDHHQMGEWYGPFTVSYTDISDSMPDNVDYLQYKVVFLTSNPDSTPVLEELTIEANHPGSIHEEDPSVTQDELSVFPNPSSGSFIISLPLWAEGTEIRIYDLHGRLVVVSSGDGIVNGLTPGLYICRSDLVNSSTRVVVLGDGM